MSGFIAELITVARQIGPETYVFGSAKRDPHGVLQLGTCSGRRISVHRLWAVEPGKGAGSAILRRLCDIADRHRTEIELKALPFGRKPYPLSRDQLSAWYRRHGFEARRGKMVRAPRPPVPTSLSVPGAERAPLSPTTCAPPAA